MKVLSNILYGLFGLVILGTIALLVLPSVPYVGHIEVKIVKSGSMEPGIKTGGIVVVREMPQYYVGDVVTFASRSADIPTTHRIIGEERQGTERVFITKGDANEERDQDTAMERDVIGKVLFTVPYLGFILDFARQPLGFALLIGLPAFLIILDEIEKIWLEMKRRRKNGEEGDDGDEGGMSDMRDGERELVYVTREDAEPLVIPAYSPRRIPMVDIRPRIETVSASMAHLPVPPIRANAHALRAHDMRPRGLTLASTLSAVTLIVVLATHTIGGTISYFNDREASGENRLEALALGFSIDPTSFSFTGDDRTLGTDEAMLAQNLTLENLDVSLLFDVSVSVATGTEALCDAVTVTTNDLAPFAYSGPLLGLTGTTLTLPSAWSYTFDLGPGAYNEGDACVFSITYRGWNDVQLTPIAYDDTEVVTLTVIAPGEEVLPLVELSQLLALPQGGEGETGSTTDEIGGETGDTGSSTDGDVPPVEDSPATTTDEGSGDTGTTTDALPPTDDVPPPPTDEGTPADVETPTEPTGDAVPGDTPTEPEPEPEPTPEPEPEPTTEPETP